MKHVLAILALVALTLPSGVATQQANAQTNLWYSGTPQIAPALKPVPLPPVEFDREYKGQLVVTKFNDYSLIRMICKDVPTAIACSYRTYKTTTGEPISCLILLGPKAHDDERALRHEIGHCNGWSNNHERARYGD
jgi:hypothetical protein